MCAMATTTIAPTTTATNRAAEVIANMSADDRPIAPRTAAIGSTPDGAQNPLWSADQFNGCWIFCCVPLCPAVFKQTNDGEDIVKAKGFMWCLPIVNETYIRNGNSNRFQGISSLEMDRGGSIQAEEEVVEFLSTTFRKNLNAPAYAMKVCK